MVPIGAIHDKSDRESDFRVIPKIREDKTLFSMGLSNARLGIMQIWKRTKKTAFPILNDSGIIQNPGIVPKQRLTDIQIETLPKQAAKEHHRILKICQIQWS